MKMGKPKVSIICITYNQEKFIKQTLDGFLMQNTHFPIEVLIHDDASTDKTKAIIKDYVKKHPVIFRPMYEKTNKFSKKDYGFIEDMFRMAKGEFIAICEGDDYWTDPSKIQRQADLLEAHKEYALCFHPVRVIFEDHNNKSYIYPESNNNNEFTPTKLLQKNFIQTNSVMYRKQSYKELKTDQLPIDWYLHIYHARFGKIGFIDRVMSVYRRHPGGVWWESHNNEAEFWQKYWELELKFFEKLIPLYKNHQENINSIYTSIANKFSIIASIDDKYKSKLLQDGVAKFPDFAARSIGVLSKENHKLSESLANVSEENKLLKKQYTNVIHSNSWKITKPLRVTKRLVKKKK